MLLLGDLGQQLDIHDMRRNLDDQRSVDMSQDEQIRELRQGNQQLKLAVTALSRLLVSKGVLSSEDVAQIGRAIEE
jgi:adenylate kinase